MKKFDRFFDNYIGSAGLVSLALGSVASYKGDFVDGASNLSLGIAGVSYWFGRECYILYKDGFFKEAWDRFNLGKDYQRKILEEDVRFLEGVRELEHITASYLSNPDIY